MAKFIKECATCGRIIKGKPLRFAHRYFDTKTCLNKYKHIWEENSDKGAKFKG